MFLEGPLQRISVVDGLPPFGFASILKRSYALLHLIVHLIIQGFQERFQLDRIGFYFNLDIRDTQRNRAFFLAGGLVEGDGGIAREI